MSDIAPLLQVIKLSKHYDTGAGTVSVLNDISLTLEQGDSLAMVGPSGSGKSTLLQIFGTLDRPSAGRVLLEGQDLSTLTEPQLAHVRSERIGFVFQAHYLLPQCTAWENVLVPTLARGEKRSMSDPKPEPAERRAERLLARVGLGERMTHFPGQLSGGERQRAAVVRALINNPTLLLADEPTGALDRASANDLCQLLVELNQEEGVTLIVVTHSMELAKRMKRVMRLENGRLHDQST